MAIFFVITISGCGGSKTNQNGQSYNVDDLLETTKGSDIYNATNNLVVEKGTAVVKRLNGDEEDVNKETDLVMGDSITVSADGEATLYWFDDSISRLRPGSQLTITAADYDPEDITETKINFEVAQGEVWSKVISLVNDDSEFTAESNGVVAGVRGSTFDFRVSEKDVFVEALEHATFVERSGKKQTLLEGKRGTLAKSVKRASELGLELEDIPVERFEEKWVKEYLEKDEV